MLFVSSLVRAPNRDLLIEDKKGGVDRSTTVIAKEPEGNLSAHHITNDSL